MKVSFSFIAIITNSLTTFVSVNHFILFIVAAWDHGWPRERHREREPAVDHREDGLQRVHPTPQHQLHGRQGVRPAPLQSQEGTPSLPQIFHKVKMIFWSWTIQHVSVGCSSLRVAEMVWKEGVLIKDFPPEAFTIKCLDDSWALLKQDDGQKRSDDY